MEKHIETLEAKLRNQLTPLYGLSDLILLLDDNPDLKPILIEMAKLAQKSKKEIDRLLIEIENK